MDSAQKQKQKQKASTLDVLGGIHAPQALDPLKHGGLQSVQLVRGRRVSLEKRVQVPPSPRWRDARALQP
jgi:hypothetical protein